LSEQNPPVARLSLLGRHPQGVPFAITIEIGAPYQVTPSREECVCPLKLLPFLPNLHDVHGGDSLQALSMALCLVGDQLQDFKDKGGTLLYAEGDSFDLDAYRLGNFRQSG